MKLSSFTKYLHLRVINTGVSRAVTVAAAILLLSACPAMAQDGVVRPSKEEAQAAWAEGDFEKAYFNYNGLLLLYSRDPLYQYYTGACLVRLERDIQRGVTLLASAINSSVNVKSVPNDVWFWYGRALQMSGSFSQAVEAFDRFSRQAGRKVATEYDVQKYIDQCNAGSGALKMREPPAGVVREATAVSAGEVSRQGQPAERVGSTSRQPAEQVGSTSRQSAVNDKVTDQIEDVAREEKTVPVPGRPVVRGDTTGVPAEYYRVLGQTLERGEEADSLLIALGKKNGNNRTVVPVQPAELPAAVRLSRFEVLPGQAYGQNNPVPVDPVLPPGLVYTIQVAAFRNNVAPALFKGLNPVFGKHRQGSEAVYYYAGLFRRIDDARNALPQAKGAGFPDAFVIAFMDGVQVSMERASLLEKEWGGYSLDATGSGSPASAATAQSGQVPSGTSTQSGQVPSGKSTQSGQVPSGKSTQLGQVPTGKSTQSGQIPSAAEAQPAPVPVGTLSFRAEVMRITKPVKPEVIQKIELLAGTRGLEMMKNSAGETVFLIGNFITFESADEYVSLLIRNGYNTAKVTAYVGTQEIPVEAAMELLNKLPDD
jgi:hypothetical protein